MLFYLTEEEKEERRRRICVYLPVSLFGSHHVQVPTQTKFNPNGLKHHAPVIHNKTDIFLVADSFLTLCVCRVHIWFDAVVTIIIRQPEIRRNNSFFAKKLWRAN